MVSQCRINERLLPVESFRRTATGKVIGNGISLNNFRKKFGDGTQPQPVPSVSPVQRLTEHKLSAIRVVAEVEPVIHFTPILGAFRDR